ncbi:hypothetical protein J2T21_002450 [Paeniglutamicibacter psychrophenolicus]|nr:hypothetical protein [Paeniglutamicibacter psychrophenolicus]
MTDASPASYAGYTDLAGPPDPRLDRLAFRRILEGREKSVLGSLLVLNLAAAAAFIALITALALRSDPGPYGWALWALVVLPELLRLAQSAGVVAFAAVASDPVPMEPVPGLRVAVLTTIVPSREPVELLLKTLRAMRAVEYDGAVDVWILDEGDDPAVREAAASLGVRHFTRLGNPDYNTSGGRFRAGTKAGNHNAWRDAHGRDYDIVAQVDPDHVPFPRFLLRTLGYFRDPDLAFVVAPQVYGNTGTSLIARAAAAQGYIFTGIIQRGGNGLGAPLLIGTNHLYRMSAWEQIGGYQDSIIEDHLTGMAVHAATNPATGAAWTGVYTPDILAVGEGPSTWTDFFGQQDRWASGIWQILLGGGREARRRLGGRQAAAYVFLQSFYPSVGLAWILGTLANITQLVWARTRTGPDELGALPLTLWCLVVCSWLLILHRMKRWYLHPAERRTSIALALLATLVAAPVYAASALAALLRRTPAYVVTGKGRLRSRERARTFLPHLLWAAALALALALAAGTAAGTAAAAWALVGISVCLLPPVMALSRPLGLRRGRHSARRFHAVRLHNHPSRRFRGPARQRPGPRAGPAAQESPQARSGTALGH